MRLERCNISSFHAVILLWLLGSFIPDIEFKIYHNTEAYTPYEKKVLVFRWIFVRPKVI